MGIVGDFYPVLEGQIFSADFFVQIERRPGRFQGVFVYDRLEIPDQELSFVSKTSFDDVKEAFYVISVVFISRKAQIRDVFDGKNGGVDARWRSKCARRDCRH